MRKRDKKSGREDVFVIAKAVNKEPGRTVKIVGIPRKIGIGMTLEAGNNTAKGI